jgi:hypothetical protein
MLANDRAGPSGRIQQHEDSVTDPTIAPPRIKLPVIDTVGAAYDEVWALRDDLLRVAAIPALATFGLNLLLHWQFGFRPTGDPVHPPELSAGVYLVMLLAWLPMTLFAVNWMRVLLLGHDAVKGLGLRWGLRETVYLLRMVAILLGAILAGVIASLPVIVAAIVYGAVAGAIGSVAGPGIGISPGLGIFLGILVAIPMVMVEFYVMFRLLLALPATALDRPRGLRLSWTMTRGTVLRLLAAYLLVVIPPYLAILVVQLLLGMAGLFELAPFSAQLIGTLMGFMVAAAGSSVLAIAYRRLGGMARADA